MGICVGELFATGITGCAKEKRERAAMTLTQRKFELVVQKKTPPYREEKFPRSYVVLL